MLADLVSQAFTGSSPVKWDKRKDTVHFHMEKLTSLAQGRNIFFLNVYYTKQIPETCAWDLATQRTYYAWDVFLAHKDSSFLGKWLWCPDLSPEKANESLQNAGPLGSKSFTQDWAIGQPELNWVNQVLLCGKSEFSIKCLLGRSLCSWIMLGVILKKGSLCCLVPEITRAALFPFWSFICSVLPGIRWSIPLSFHFIPSLAWAAQEVASIMCNRKKRKCFASADGWL